MKNRCSELILVLLVCVSPWAYGSVEARAELWLYAGIALLTILNNRGSVGCNRRGRWNRLPGMALFGLVLLALLQAMPLRSGLLSWMAPSLAADRAQLLPGRPERVLGDTNAAVALPTNTLSLEPDSTFQTAARLSAAWLLFQAVIGLGTNPGVSLRVVRVVVVNAALLALFAIVQGLTWNGRIYWLRLAHASAKPWSAGGPFLNHSHLSAYLNMGLGLALGLLLQGTSRDFLRRDSMKLWTAYGAAIIAVGVIVSHSRSGFLGLLAASFLLGCFLGRRLIAEGLGLAVMLAMVGLCLALVAGSSPFGSRLATILDFDNEGYWNRFEIWRGALRAWWARPLWGSGFGAFPIAITPYLGRGHSGTAFFARAENEYVDLLVEGGAVGLILVLAFLAGIGVLGRRAIHLLPDARQRGFVGGAVFGLIALSVQSCADFAPHVPAVGVLAVVLCALIAGHGHAGGLNLKRDSARLRWLGPVVLSVFVVSHGVREAWIENRLDRAGLPAPGTYLTTVGTLETLTWGLGDYRAALEDVVRRRPNWSEGHLRLGMVHLALYRQMTKEWLNDSGVGRRDMDSMAEPLWLLGTVHQQPERAAAPREKPDVLRFEPVLTHLVAAAHCFLEARRCSPFLALPHAELAALDYLLVSEDSASTYASRALMMSGHDASVLPYLGQVAVQTGDRKLAAQCYRKSLESDHSSWPEIADAAQMVLSPDEILSEVATDGGDAVRFADRLYRETDSRAIRNRFLAAAVARFSVCRETKSAEQLFLEAHALACLDESARAAKQMAAALVLKPAQAAWRQEFIEWLLRWGRADEAHAQALAGRYFSPESNSIRAAVDRTAEVLARGATLP